MNYSEEYKDCLEYIDQFWDKVTIRPKKRERLLNIIIKKATKRMHENIINLPKSFIIPNATNMGKKNKTDSPGWFAHIFYWDTFFMFKGLLRTRHEWITRSMVDNFIYLYEKYGIIPNFNSPASIGRSQPPFLTSMIFDAYNRYYYSYRGMNPFKKLVYDLEPYKEWLQKASDVAKREYWKVWIDEDGFYHHKVNGYNLSRYGDRDIGYAHSAELESGWDFTSRFYNRCNEFLPIDLNCLLYKYERDFAKIARILGDKDEDHYWKSIAEKRKEEINKYMWNGETGFFYDYGYVNKRQSDFLSLAGFMPLWTRLATPAQAKKMVKMLPYFETEYGLTITAQESLAPKVSLRKIPIRFRHAIEDVLKPKQWDYPNIWPPLEYLTVIGLLKYGFVDDAKRIMNKSVTAQGNIFRKYKTFFEKINGETGDINGNYHYAQQAGFGWTNATFYRYVQILDALENGENIYVEPKGDTPPYKLSIPH
ncbi:MAG TPA: trehalase family glycosidase [Patescibacteria group bacterium]|nr:trehalase family glycosidase [Patescibacteria group bacterium]